ncbi:hypothetical protein N2152v2_003667 [Parachlorella kessleri]
MSEESVLEPEGSASADGCKLFIYNLSKRFGFALFMDAAEADIATQALQGTVLFGKAIEIKSATAPEPTALKQEATQHAKLRLSDRKMNTSEGEGWSIGAHLVDSAIFPPLSQAAAASTVAAGGATASAAAVVLPPTAALERQDSQESSSSSTSQCRPVHKPKTMTAEYMRPPLTNHPVKPPAAGFTPQPWEQELPAAPAGWNPLSTGSLQSQLLFQPHTWNGAQPPQLQHPAYYPPPPLAAALSTAGAAGAGGLPAPAGRRVLAVHHGPGADLARIVDAFRPFNMCNAQLNAEGFQSLIEFRCPPDAFAAQSALHGQEVDASRTPTPQLSVALPALQPEMKWQTQQQQPGVGGPASSPREGQNPFSGVRPLNVAAPEFHSCSITCAAGSPAQQIERLRLSGALDWIHGAVQCALEGRSYKPAWAPRAGDMPASIEDGQGAAPAGMQPVSVLRGTLVRVLIDKSYSLRLVMDTQLDGQHLMLVLNDVPHPVQADHISNQNPLTPCKAGEAVSQEGRMELLELHGRVAFKGLRMKREDVAQVAWRLSAAAKYSREPDKQQAAHQLRAAFEDKAGVEKLVQQVQPANPIEEAQILQAAFSLPAWKQSACWIPAEGSLEAKQTPVAKPHVHVLSAGTPGTQEQHMRNWLGELFAFQPGAGQDHRCSPTADTVRAAAAKLFALVPPPSPQLEGGSRELTFPDLFLGGAAEAAAADNPAKDAVGGGTVTDGEDFTFRSPITQAFYTVASGTADSCGFLTDPRPAHLSTDGTDFVPKQLPFAAEEAHDDRWETDEANSSEGTDSENEALGKGGFAEQKGAALEGAVCRVPCAKPPSPRLVAQPAILIR